MQQLTESVTSEGLKGDCQYLQGGQRAPFLPWPLPAWHGHLASCNPIRTINVLVCAQMWLPTKSKLTFDLLHDLTTAMLRGHIIVSRQSLLGTKPLTVARCTTAVHVYLRRVMDMRRALTGGTQCCATSAPLPFSTRQEPAKSKILKNLIVKSRCTGLTCSHARLTRVEDLLDTNSSTTS